MYKGYRYIDADAHILEPANIWEKYLEAEYRSPMPRSIVEYSGDPLAFRVQVLVGEQGMPYGPEGTNTPMPGLDTVYAEYAQKGFAPECYRHALDKTGIDYMVVYPTLGLSLFQIEDPPFQQALFRAYNDWVSDFCKGARGWLKGVGLISTLDMDSAAAEVRRVRTLGLSGVDPERLRVSGSGC